MTKKLMSILNQFYFFVSNYILMQFPKKFKNFKLNIFKNIIIKGHISANNISKNGISPQFILIIKAVSKIDIRIRI